MEKTRELRKCEIYISLKWDAFKKCFTWTEVTCEYIENFLINNNLDFLRLYDVSDDKLCIYSRSEIERIEIWHYKGS